MSNISNNPSNNAAIQAIEDAIRIAARKVCHDPKGNLKGFDPWEEGDLLTQSSQDFCNRFFSAEIAAKKRQIPKGQQTPNLVSYAGTRGWLHGYSCAQDKAKPVIEKLQETQCNLNKKTEEANKLKNELEKLESTDKGKLHRRLKFATFCCGVLFIVAAVAIAIIAIN